ncbi:MAG: hypothetical protein U0324_12540 [Polyangiales bacterium]
MHPPHRTDRTDRTDRARPDARPVARASAALAAAAALAVGGCSSQQAPTLFSVTLRVMTDQRPMPGAQVVIRDRPQGTTDAQGSFRMRMAGTEGAVVEVTVRCPEGFQSPAEAVRVPLRSAVSLDRNAQATGIETTIQCPPDQRVAAVIVRTPNRANLPVVFQGREVTRTDLQGVAHMIFKVHPRDVLAFRIDTSSQPQLRPASPTFTVATRDGDDVYVSTLNFEEAAAPRQVRRPARPSAPVLQRIPPSRNRVGGFF